MSKIKVDTFLKAEDLDGATSKAPMESEIVAMTLVPISELGFASDEDRWEIKVKVKEEEYDWLANKTSLRAFVAAFGDETDTWMGKKIKLYSVEQNVGGKIKQVVYGTV